MSARQPTLRELTANRERLARQLQRLRVAERAVLVKDGEHCARALRDAVNLYALKLELALREEQAARIASGLRAGAAR